MAMSKSKNNTDEIHQAQEEQKEPTNTNKLNNTDATPMPIGHLTMEKLKAYKLAVQQADMPKNESPPSTPRFGGD